MIWNSRITASIGGALGLLSMALAEPDVEHHPLSVGALSEMGPIVNGLYAKDDESFQELEDEWINHFGVHILKSLTVNKRIHLTAGFAGSFQYRKPEQGETGSTWDREQRPAFFTAPIALFQYDFFDAEDPWLSFQMGSLTYKYNPDATVLGEHLFRARPYPTLLYTGGYQVVNSATAYLQGARLGISRENYSVDMLVTTETSMPPFYDFSLGLVGSYKLMGGLIDLGAGVYFKSLIPVRNDRTARQISKNGYVRHQGEWYSTNENVYLRQANFYDNKYARDSLQADSISMAYFQERADSAGAISSSGIPLEYYTAAGALVMGRINIDIKKAIPMDFLGKRDLRVFAEATLLGVNNYPVFYENRMERLPVMAGFNLPAFKWLDVVSVQVEYLNSPWLNNSNWVGRDNLNIPYHPQSNATLVSKNSYLDLAERDNWKWALYLERGIGQKLTFRAEMGSTHLQVPSSYYFFGPQFGTQEITTTTNNWYWLVQMAWGI